MHILYVCDLANTIGRCRFIQITMRKLIDRQDNPITLFWLFSSELNILYNLIQSFRRMEIRLFVYLVRFAWQKKTVVESTELNSFKRKLLNMDLMQKVYKNRSRMLKWNEFLLLMLPLDPYVICQMEIISSDDEPTKSIEGRSKKYMEFIQK